jgi:hypothetical protein
MTVQKPGGTWFNEPDIKDMTTPEQRAAALATVASFATVATFGELVAMLGLAGEA